MRKLVQVLERLSGLPDWLNWLLSVVEPLLVLGITASVGYVGYRLVFVPSQPSRTAELLKFIQTVGENWKAAVILLLILFYRTVRVFLEQIEKGPLGMERRRPLQVQEPEEEANPTPAEQSKPSE
jgi:hypothetical protein